MLVTVDPSYSVCEIRGSMSRALSCIYLISEMAHSFSSLFPFSGDCKSKHRLFWCAREKLLSAVAFERMPGLCPCICVLLAELRNPTEGCLGGFESPERTRIATSLSKFVTPYFQIQWALTVSLVCWILYSLVCVINLWYLVWLLVHEYPPPTYSDGLLIGPKCQPLFCRLQNHFKLLVTWLKLVRQEAAKMQTRSPFWLPYTWIGPGLSPP